MGRGLIVLLYCFYFNLSSFLGGRDSLKIKHRCMKDMCKTRELVDIVCIKTGAGILFIN